MRRLRRQRSGWVVAFVLVISCAGSSGCGGGAAPSSGAGAASPPNEPMARCLATARAKRERRRDEPAKISVKQIVVKHSGAKQAPPGLKRTREDACMRALEARGMLEAGADFDGAIEEYSEEPGAPGTRGKMPDIRRTDVAPRFADAAFELEVNQVSAVVETEQGFHVIIRTE